MKRSVILSIAVSEDEKARILAAAQAARRTMSAWARLVLLDALPKEMK